jgi:hypothetical protein
MSVTINQAEKIILRDSKLASYWASDSKRDESNIFYAGHLNFQEEFSIIFAFLDQGQLQTTEDPMILNSVRCIKNSE